MGDRLGQIGAAILIWFGLLVVIPASAVGAATTSVVSPAGLDSAAVDTPLSGATAKNPSDVPDAAGAEPTGGFSWVIAGVGTIAVVLVVVVVVRSRRGRKIDLEAYLIVRSGSRTGLRYRIEKAKTRIGSQEDNDLIITDDHVSRHHLCLTYEKGAFAAVDLNSLYGTYVDGKRIERVPTAPGGKINLGGSVDLELFIRA